MSHDCDCNDAIDQIYQYLDSEVDRDTAASIRRHLDDCDGCFESFDFERRLKGVIRDCLTEDMPERLEGKVRELIRDQTTPAS